MGMLLFKNRKQARYSLYSQEDAPLPDFSQGETRPISVALISEIPATVGAQLYTPQVLTGWTFRAGLGNGFLPPIAGVYTISFDGQTTVPLAYNADADDMETALNDLPNIIAAGGVTVNVENKLFIFIFGNVGAQPALSGDPDNLAPLCIMDFGRLVQGQVNINEVQTLRIVQNPGAFADLATASAPAAATVTVNRVGGGGYNHKITVDFISLVYGDVYQTPYAGKWTLLVGGVETVPIDYAASVDDVRAAVEILSSVGAGNVSVSANADGSFLLSFQGAKANTDMGAIASDGSLLSVIPYLSGTLDCRTPGIDLLLGGQEETRVFFEIEGTPPAGTVQKLFRQEVGLIDSILDPSDQTPQPFDQYLTQAASDGRYQKAFVAPPATMTSAGTVGQEAVTLIAGAYYHYICVAANKWQRKALNEF